MNLTRQQKILIGVLGSALLIWAADALIFGGPSEASANSRDVYASPQSSTFASTSIDATQPQSPSNLSPEVSPDGQLRRALQAVGEQFALQADTCRNGFDPPQAWRQMEPDEPEVPEIELLIQRFRSEHRLVAVMCGEHPAAMINDKVIPVGHSIDGFELIDITPGRACFVREDREVELRIEVKP